MSLIAFKTKNYNTQSDSPVTAEECTAEDITLNFIVLIQNVDVP